MSTAANSNISNISLGNKKITIIGTAHVSRDSAELVKSIIEEQKPDTVCVELCQSRLYAMRQKDRWQNMDIVQVIREKKAFVLLSNLILASFQKKIGDKLHMRPGEEMLQAVEAAEHVGARVRTCDRDIRITMTRVWRLMGLWTKTKLFFHSLLSLGTMKDITEEMVEEMKRQDILETMLAEIGRKLPEIRSVLIDERDQYLAEKIRTVSGENVVAVVGAGHVPGITKYFSEQIDIEKLEKIPNAGWLQKLLKWLIPAVIMGLFVYGFTVVGTKAGVEMITWWSLITGVLAGLGAVAALAHPFSIAAAIVSAPVATIHPLIATGWVSGLVEAFSRKPTVRDFENLIQDITTFRGFWRNKITRILLVVAFTNIGSASGTLIALPMLIKVFS